MGRRGRWLVFRRTAHGRGAHVKYNLVLSSLYSHKQRGITRIDFAVGLSVICQTRLAGLRAFFAENKVNFVFSNVLRVETA
jgi:hypothetical protein